MITTFEKRCVLNIYVIVLRPIFNTTYKGEIQVKVYMIYLHQELVLFQESRTCFRYVPDNDTEEDTLVWNPLYTMCSVSRNIFSPIAYHYDFRMDKLPLSH